jgi:hypothetical protein
VVAKVKDLAAARAKVAVS